LLFKVVLPKHLKSVKSISWAADYEPASTSSHNPAVRTSLRFDPVLIYTEALNDQIIHLGSVIMLLELGLLGKCRVKMTLHNEPRLHVACQLRDLIRIQITHEHLKVSDTWNENSIMDSDIVAGLSKAVTILA
jgi:hypothetical protein